MRHHEIDRLGCGEVRSKYHIAFVLAIFIIYDDDHASLAITFKRLVD